jgi:hypothetical protein
MPVRTPPFVRDLAVATFQVLRDAFFDKSGQSLPFDLRPKRNTQDDPFDEYVHQRLQNGLRDATCEKAPGALITPDMVVLRKELCLQAPRQTLRDDLTRIVGIEV